MRPEPNNLIDKFRKPHPERGTTLKGVSYGWFEINGMRVMSSGSHDESEWEHVSISLPRRTPTWVEMCFVKSLFWEPEETVVQFHPKQSEYVDDHSFCLHLWKKRGVEFELPPNHYVGRDKHNVLHERRL
jgi:hypothetical protein